METLAPSGPARLGSRLVGIDLARAVALLGVVTMNYTETFNLSDLARRGVGRGPGWLEHLLAPFEGPLKDAMVDALMAEDPGARVLPYCLSGGTDNKALSTIGIRGFGFAPLQLPPDMDFPAMFHGVDERVPLDALRFGVRVLDRFVRAS